MNEDDIRAWARTMAEVQADLIENCASEEEMQERLEQASRKYWGLREAR